MSVNRIPNGIPIDTVSRFVDTASRFVLLEPLPTPPEALTPEAILSQEQLGVAPESGIPEMRPRESQPYEKIQPHLCFSPDTSGEGVPIMFPRRVERLSLVDELADSLGKLAVKALEFINSIPDRLKAFYSEHKEEISRGAKILSGVILVTSLATAMPSLIATVARLGASVLSQNIALFFASAKIALCTVGILFGLGLLFSRSEDQLPVASDN